MLSAHLLGPDIMEQRILNWDVPLRCLVIYSEFEEIIKFLKKVKEDKPPFVHKIHKHQLRGCLVPGVKNFGCHIGYFIGSGRGVRILIKKLIT
jgi:hypothetical protein